MTSPSEQRPGRRNPPLRASTLELFFDLVFVFTITQLTGCAFPLASGAPGYRRIPSSLGARSSRLASQSIAAGRPFGSRE
jgi:hypothetical protein